MNNSNNLKELKKKITILEKENKELREKTDELDALYNYAMDGIILTSLTGKILKVNKMIVETGGFSEKEVLGKNIKMLTMFTPKSIAKMLSAIAKLLSGQKVARYDVEATSKKGKKIIAEVHSSVFQKDKKPAGFVTILRDITEKKEKEKELHAKNLELEKFNKLMIGREIKMIELKKQIEKLGKKLKAKN